MSYRNYGEYLKHPVFLKSVDEARLRAGGVCEQCRAAARTEPHHLRYCRWGDFDPPENLIMLCRSCHTEAHRCRRCGQIALKAHHIKRGLFVCCEGESHAR